jgi:hypothetical protein
MIIWLIIFLGKLGLKSTLSQFFGTYASRSLLNDSHPICHLKTNTSVISLLPSFWKRFYLPWKYHNESDFLLYRQYQAPQFRKDHWNFFNKKFTRVPHLLYSPNITLSDFYFFGIIKQRFCGCQVRSFKDLHENIHWILDAVPRRRS